MINDCASLMRRRVLDASLGLRCELPSWISRPVDHVGPFRVTHLTKHKEIAERQSSLPFCNGLRRLTNLWILEHFGTFSWLESRRFFKSTSQRFRICVAVVWEGIQALGFRDVLERLVGLISIGL